MTASTAIFCYPSASQLDTDAVRWQWQAMSCAHMPMHRELFAAYLAHSFSLRSAQGTHRCTCSTCWCTCLHSGTSWFRNSSSALHSLEFRKTITLYGFNKEKAQNHFFNYSNEKFEFLCKKKTRLLQVWIFSFFKNMLEGNEAKCGWQKFI